MIYRLPLIGRRFFIEITRLDMSSAARFILKKYNRCTRTGFSFLFGFLRCPGDVAVGDSGAGAWNKGIFRSEATPFSRVRAHKYMRALNYG